MLTGKVYDVTTPLGLTTLKYCVVPAGKPQPYSVKPVPGPPLEGVTNDSGVELEHEYVVSVKVVVVLVEDDDKVEDVLVIGGLVEPMRVCENMKKTITTPTRTITASS